MPANTVHTAESIPLCKLPSGTSVETLIHRYSGAEPGPTAYIQAAQHGREITGTEIIRRLHETLSSTPLNGDVLTVPVANPLSFNQVSQNVSEEIDSGNPNMNGVWPGSENGSLHERMAARLWEHAVEADVIIDLHSISAEQLPHVRVTSDDPASLELAETFGTEMVIPKSLSDDARNASDTEAYRGILREAAYLENIPHLTPEIGHSRQLSLSVVDSGVTGTMDVLRDVDILPGDPVGSADPIKTETHLAGEPADHSGLFVPEPALELGQEVAAGERLGQIVDPMTFECCQQITAMDDGFLWYIGREGAVVAGDGVIGVAVPAETTD